jgi:hypothetical protein
MESEVRAVVSVILMGFFGVLTVATVIGGLSSSDRPLSSLGALRILVPQWNFFAPAPDVHDYHLLYRDDLGGGRISPWRALTGHLAARRFRASVWNPEKFQQKALFDVVQEMSLVSLEYEDVPASVRLSLPYILLLQYVSAISRSRLSLGTQFLLMRRDPTTEACEVVFLSEFHAVES